MPVEDTLADLRLLKAQRSRQRELRDLEERKLLDELYDTDRRLRGSPRQRDNRKKLQLSKDETVREMQIQYERHRERDLLAGVRKRNYRRKPEPPRYNPSADPKVKQLAESHGRNMESFHNKNRDLERQREEIRRRLEGLGRRPIKEDDSMNALLQELKDQEARNQRMLEELRRILASQNIPMPHVSEPKTSRYVYPIYYGNSLVAEIIAVRQAYIQNGGNDPDILQQLAQMQAEAQAIDDSLRNRPAIKIKGKSHPDNSNLFALELENERLQRQLLLLQEQNVQARHRRKDDREGRRRGPRPRAISMHRLFQPQVHQPRRRAITNYTELRPLDVTRAFPPPRRKPPEQWVLERTDITAIDRFKEKIDSDLQNKFGYDLGGSRMSFVRHQVPEDISPRTGKDRSHEGVTTLVPEHGETQSAEGVTTPVPEPGKTRSHEGVTTLVPGVDDSLVGPKPTSENDRDTRLPPLDLKSLVEAKPDANSPPPQKLPLSGQPVRKEWPRPDRVKALALNLGGRGPATGPAQATNDTRPSATKASVTHNQPTQFEDEFFAHTSRTDPGGNPLNAKRARYILDHTSLSQYKPLDEQYGGKPGTETKRSSENITEGNKPNNEPTVGRHREKSVARKKRAYVAEKPHENGIAEAAHHGSESDICRICKDYVAHWPLIKPDEEIVAVDKTAYEIST
ncbi:coiled-coil domain-containing protein 17 [Plakobranchus ocellatus]|uniref:Coiled-coil domain-containing protein 17 n=1 Tax=Plakobranchus ocellatus TaxID=259542 RepID=A0AAV3YBN3_9GAST|nr:coiled-coil domain-containing protein 17 [Plakobranchus ocellatus]